MKMIQSTLIALLFFSGCSTVTPSTQEYTINPKATIEKSVKSDKIIRLATTKSIPSLMSKHIIYIRANGESGNYLYSRWSDIPSVMIEHAILNTLNEHSVFKAILPSTSVATADLLIESDLVSFTHSFDASGKSYGVIDITYRLIDPKTKMTISSKRFFITTEADSLDAKGGVKALNKATQLLSEQFILWLNSTIIEKA